MSNYNILKNKLLFKKYKVIEILGKGSFGWVFLGKNILDNSDVAIKAERRDAKNHLLELESNFLSILKGYGIPEIKSYGLSGRFCILVQELLGDNLSQIKLKLNKFTLKDIAMMAIQIIDRIEFVHSKNIIHRDIKPENFLIGYRNDSIIYIIDFGISKQYRSSRTGKHIRFSLTGKMFGTVRYVSYNASRGVEQSRRDDLESIGYMLICLFKGNLPWKGIKLKEDNAYKKYIEMLYLKKNIPPESLCCGLPSEFVDYVKYCKGLAFEQDPDYEYLRNLFRKILLDINQINDMKFSWSKNVAKNILKMNGKGKYINLTKRKESPHTRLYRAIQNSLNKDEKSIKRGNSQLSLEQTNILTDRNNERDNTNLSKDITYDSLLAQYNVNVSKFQDENKIFEIFSRKRKGKGSNLSLNKYNSNLYSWNKNLFDYKSTECNMKNYSRESFFEKNKNKNFGLGDKKYSLSNDNKNYIKIYKLSDIKKKVSKSQEIKRKISKQKLFSNNMNNEKKNAYKNNINICMNLKDMKSKNNSLDNNIKNCNNNFFEITKSRVVQKSSDNINQNLLNKFNSNENSFSFKNLNIEEYENKGKIDIEKYNFEKKSKIPKNNMINLNKCVKCQKLNENNAKKRTQINSDNINLNINYLNKNIKNDGRINIIINNNLRNSFRDIPNKIINIKKKKFNSENFLSKNSKNKNSLNKDKDDEIIENDYNSYQYINKIPKNKYNIKNIKLIQYNRKSNNLLNNYNNNYIYSSNIDILSKVKKIPNKMKIKILEYKPFYMQKIKSYNINHNSISQNNDLKGKNTSFKYSSFVRNDNSFLVGKIKNIKLQKSNEIKNNICNSYNKSINNISDNINIKNNGINEKKYFHSKNNLSNDIKYYNFKPNNIIYSYKNDLRNTKKFFPKFSIDFKNQKNEYDIEIKSEDQKTKRNNPSISNKKKKKGLNFNSNFVEDLKNINHIPKNINNMKMKKNKIIPPKCFNKFQI